MSVKELYAHLMDALGNGHQAIVASTCHPQVAVEKRLVTTEDPTAFAALVALSERSDALTSGPVTSMTASDGSLTVLERYCAKPRLIILGCGHIAVALAAAAKFADFELLVYDDRPSFANSQRFPQAETIVCDGFDRLFERVTVRPSDYVVILTRGHKHDTACLKGILAGPEPAYTGMIGSRRRVGIVMDQLRQAGHDIQRLGRVHSPIGLRIGGVTPGEIAISIMAEIVQVKRLERLDSDYLSCDLEVVEALARRGTAADAMITIIETRGSVPIDTGAKLAMTYAGELVGTIGGGCSEADAMQVAREVIRSGAWRTHVIDMTDSAEDDGMVCGGEMRVLIESL
jgi:xanthine dehydrogenase accessory factor